MYRRAHILSNGSVGVCSCRDIEGEIVIGDVNKSSLEDIWKGKKLQKYRNDWAKSMPKVCMETVIVIDQLMTLLVNMGSRDTASI